MVLALGSVLSAGLDDCRTTEAYGGLAATLILIIRRRCHADPEVAPNALALGVLWPDCC